MFLPRILFVVIFVSIAPASFADDAPAAGSYNIRAFGATGDGKTLDTPAINKAIDAASRAGGGTVEFPAGTYLCGSIHLKSDIHLYLDAGATILGAPQEMNAYDEPEPFPGKTYQDYGHSHFHNSLIWGENLTNISITGPGTINGGGLLRGIKQPNSSPTTGGVPYENFTAAGNPAAQGNKAIALKLCRGIILRDFTIAHGGWFGLLATGCDNMTVDNLTIDTNRDGMDIDCCRNATISNCRVNSPNDDGICPKSSYALGEPRITENLTITNCHVSGFEEGTLIDGSMKPSAHGTGRIKFGTEASGGFRNCTVSNCTFRSCHGLALEEVDGGIMENITITNLSMTDLRQYAIYITTGKRNRTPDLKTNSRARNILISNVIADGVDKMAGIEITGLPEQPIEGVRLENIRLTSAGGGTAADAAVSFKELGLTYPEPSRLGVAPAYGIFARHVKDLELADVRVGFAAAELRPAASFADIQGLQVDNFIPQVADGVAAAIIAGDVQSLVFRNSPALEALVK